MKIIKTIPLVARGPSYGGKLSCKMTALNRCTVTDSLRNRYADCRSSLNLEEILRPRSRRKSTADYYYYYYFLYYSSSSSYYYYQHHHHHYHHHHHHHHHHKLKRFCALTPTTLKNTPMVCKLLSKPQH